MNDRKRGNTANRHRQTRRPEFFDLRGRGICTQGGYIMTGRTMYDITLPISESFAVWPGDPPVKISQSSHMKRGDKNTVSRLAMGAHTGTHVDAPSHFILDGAGVDTLDLTVLVGPAVVIDTGDAALLTSDVLESLSIPLDCDRIIFHTRNSALWNDGYSSFNPGFTALSEDGAQWLAARGVRLVGIDYLSVAPYEESTPTHRALLSAGIIIVEGLDLRGIRAGRYELICLPLRIVGIDGAPARAILIDDPGTGRTP